MSGTSTGARRVLHAVAEYLLAGPQYRTSGTIRLRPTDGGFGTVAAPDIRVDGRELVTAHERLELRHATLAELADAAGVEAGPPDGVYESTLRVGMDDRLELDSIDVAKIAEVFAIGDAALRRLSKDATPVIWPEHFDIGIRLDETNFGVSPGDDFLDVPYAYVGVDNPPQGEFWNAPFGAARPLADLAGAEAVWAFFREGLPDGAGLR
jgi:hypothetical protein